MEISSLLNRKSKKQSGQIKLLTAAVLSVIYTTVFAFIIYGSLFYPVNHLLFDLVYAFVFFLLLYEGFRLLRRWQQKHLSHFKLYQQHLLGLLVFIVFSLLLVNLVGILPFMYIFQMTPVGEIEFSMELRLNYVVNVLFAGVYYLILMGFYTLKNYHEVEMNAQVLQKEIAQAQYEGLKNQVNPHFLFNSLNVLTSLVHQDAELSERFIDKLAKAYRYVLEQRDQELVSLKTEIDFINSYIFLLKIRFEEKLQVNISVPAKKLSAYLPPLTLQLLLENAVKHNILSAESPLIVDITVDEDDYLLVKNNVQLRPQEYGSTGVGLKNIETRYRYFTPKKVYFRLSENMYLARVPLLFETED